MRGPPVVPTIIDAKWLQFQSVNAKLRTSFSGWPYLNQFSPYSLHSSTNDRVKNYFYKMDVRTKVCG